MNESQALEIVANVCNRVPLNMEDNNLLRQALAVLNDMKERLQPKEEKTVKKTPAK